MFIAKITDNFSFLILTTSGSCMIPTSNCFYVIILTNFYQLPWLKEKEIKREGDPRYVKADHAIISWSNCFGNIIVALDL